MSYSTILIGLGQIGLEYDYELNSEEFILTHAQAIHAHPAFDLIGGIDIHEKNRKKFEEKFHKPTFAEINAVTRIADLDIVVVAVPAAINLETFKKIVARFSPKLILIEKPLSFLFEEAQEIVRIGKEKNVPMH